ncbi:MAG: hypothetical protein ACFB15_24625 [Cyclobacteriaceae bacterium]
MEYYRYYDRDIVGKYTGNRGWSMLMNNGSRQEIKDQKELEKFLKQERPKDDTFTKNHNQKVGEFNKNISSIVREIDAKLKLENVKLHNKPKVNLAVILWILSNRIDFRKEREWVEDNKIRSQLWDKIEGLWDKVSKYERSRGYKNEGYSFTIKIDFDGPFEELSVPKGYNKWFLKKIEDDFNSFMNDRRSGHGIYYPVHEYAESDQPKNQVRNRWLFLITNFLINEGKLSKTKSFVLTVALVDKVFTNITPEALRKAYNRAYKRTP